MPFTFDVREAGRKVKTKRRSSLQPGPQMREGNRLVYPKEYGVAPDQHQPDQYPGNSWFILPLAEVCRRAEARGIRVTGSGSVGLIPLQAMLDAGKYFLRKTKSARSVVGKGTDQDRRKINGG